MGKRALVSLTFDDGLQCHFDRAVPILDQHGFSATFFLVANTDRIHTDGFSHPAWPKTNWSKEDTQRLKEMIDRGHEIGAHSVTHRRPELDNNPRFEAEGSKQWIEDRLEDKMLSYCYPFCHVTEPIKSAVMSAKYEQARGGANAAYYSLQGSVDSFNVDCRHIGKNGAENVDGWLRADSWHVLMFHGIGTVNDGWWPISVAEFARQMAALADHRDAGTVEVVTFKNGATRLRQPK
jgi:peptidoglycan/xylan/chitin deacetylase (PgdA/CDA1 family)